MLKILIATPLYPPDIADPAPYVKELASRLKESCEVTVLAYNHIPEKIPGVKIVTVEKLRPLPVRLLEYIYALFKHIRNADLVYAQNGPSTELPVSIVSFFVRTPFMLRLGDEVAMRFASKSFLLNTLQQLAMSRAQRVIVHSESVQKGKKTIYTPRPHNQPEILPFAPYPKDELSAYERSWNEHVVTLKKIFQHGT